ncbi:MAG: hypothetical protein K9J85_11815 [Desulfobacteraceae bacterium]|nr:hypothetical protein [Desulfobacteraceae bacterium]
MNMGEAAADMFSSRLGKMPGYTTIADSRIKTVDINPDDMDLDNALAAGQKLNANLVLYGSLTILGESWSMDAFLADVANKRLIDTFSRSGASREEMIPGVENIAKEMKKSLEAAAGKKTEKPSASDEPEAPYAGFKEAEPTRRQAPGAWSGPEMHKDFIGIAAGDITGDGTAETVLLDEEAVYIYKISGKDFILEEKIDAPFNTKCLAVDAADINENQRAEIFVTAKNDRGNMLRSFVLEYKEGDFEIILEKSPWFYRVVRGSGNEPMLLGQRHRTGADPFVSEIFRLIFKNKEYRQGESIKNNIGINVLGFTPAQIREREKETEAATFNNQDRLVIVNSEGKTAWKSNRQYGGTSLFIEGPVEGRGEPPKRFYLPGRIIVAGIDTDRSAPARIFLFNNSDPSPVSLKRLRVYTRGEILSMIWDGTGLQEEWKTREYDGHFRDICLADLTDDGRPELATVLIEKQGWTPLSDVRSRVLVFPMGDQ